MKRPNLLFIMADHELYYRHGWDNGPRIQKPNYDRFASEGVCFSHAYSSNPLCGPTRKSILTGLYSHKHGEILNDVNAPIKTKSYLQTLTDAGYRNYYFGKWHAGLGTAKDHGCEGYCYPSYGNPYITPEYINYLEKHHLPNPQIMIEHTMDPWRHDIIPGKLYVQNKEWTNEEASGILLTPKETHEAFFLANLVCECLERLKSEADETPFSLRLDFWGPHPPYFVTQEFANLYDSSMIPEYPSFNSKLLDKPSCYRKEHNLGICDEEQNLIYPNPIPWKDWQIMLSRCYAHISMIDAAAGMVLSKLRELEMESNTLVIWTSDHGDALSCQGGKFDKASYMVEEVLRIPLAVKFPGRIEPGQVSDALVSNLDIPATLLDAAGLSFDYIPDGKSLLELETNRFKNRREFFVSETYGHLHRNIAKTLVDGRYKFTYNKDDISEFYDLSRDPYEIENLALLPEHKNILEVYENKLRQWANENNDNFFCKDGETILSDFLNRATNKPRDY